jgi:hypothetical protein
LRFLAAVPAKIAEKPPPKTGTLKHKEFSIERVQFQTLLGNAGRTDVLGSVFRLGGPYFSGHTQRLRGLNRATLLR